MVFPKPAPDSPPVGLPVPTLWLLGRSQSGKSSIIKVLTNCDAATIGNGYVPCTRATRSFDFPPGVSPAMRFLDTRGIDEAAYDPAEDIAACNNQAHMILVVMRLMDRAQSRVLEILDKALRSNPNRPVMHVLTCLHEGYPGRGHPRPYPFAGPPPWNCSGLDLSEFNRLVKLQLEAMGNRAGRTVLLDFTPPEDGYHPANYGADSLRENILDMLPESLRHGLPEVGEGNNPALEAVIRRHAYWAATTGGIPIPGLDLVGVTAIQARMVNELGKVMGMSENPGYFLRLAGPLVISTLGRRVATSLIKMIPGVGSILGALSGAAINGISTLALGRLFVWHCRAHERGHAPSMDEIREEYSRRFQEAARQWAGG